MASHRALVAAAALTVVVTTAAGCTISIRANPQRSEPPPEARLTEAEASNLSIDASDPHRFTVKVTLGNDSEQPFDLSQVHIDATVDQQDVHADQDRPTGTLMPGSRVSVDRAFTSDQPVSTESLVHVVIDAGPQGSYDLDVSGN